MAGEDRILRLRARSVEVEVALGRPWWVHGALFADRAKTIPRAIDSEVVDCVLWKSWTDQTPPVVDGVAVTVEFRPDPAGGVGRFHLGQDVAKVSGVLVLALRGDDGTAQAEDLAAVTLTVKAGGGR